MDSRPGAGSASWRAFGTLLYWSAEATGAEPRGICPELRNAQAGVRLVARRPVGFAAALDDGDLGLEVIPGRRALRCGAHHINRVVLALGRSFEARIFLDRQRSMENIAFDDSGTVELDAACMDRTLDLSADGQ